MSSPTTSRRRSNPNCRCTDGLRVRRSEFFRAVDDEFGANAASLLHDLVLSGLGSRTADEALDAGEPPRAVWLALCAEMDVPENRRYGAGRLEPRKR